MPFSDFKNGRSPCESPPPHFVGISCLPSNISIPARHKLLATHGDKHKHKDWMTDGNNHKLP
jgi:hypothetical protein